jgi:hypothetical protein
MKHVVDTRKSNRDTKLMIGLMLAALLAIGPSLFLPRYWALVPPAMLWGLAFIPALRLEAFKQKADVHTYQEILAYMQGKDVETLRKQRNKRHDTWAKAKIVLLFAVVSGVIALLVSMPYLLLH